LIETNTFFLGQGIMDDKSSTSHDELGPLPLADGNSELQERSIKALHALLRKTDDLVLRDERTNNFGVDCSLEVRLFGFMTNLRAQVQLKASGGVNALKDGSVSLSVKTANLNYLLNGVVPIYLLYDSIEDKFWYTWARDEATRLETSTPKWRDQASVIIKFTKLLSDSSLRDVREQIISEGKLHRTIRDALARSAGRETVVMMIDRESLKTTDSAQARDLLLTSGAAIVAAGFPAEVLELLGLVEPSIRDLPRIQFIEAYALFTKGDHYMALGIIKRALAKRAQLAKQEASFAETLRDTSEQRLGIIDKTTYRDRLAARSEALTGLEALEARQDLLYHRCLAEKESRARSALLDELRTATDEIIDHPEATRGIKLDARIVLLYAEGMHANLIASQNLLAADIRGQLFPGDVRGIIDRVRAARHSRSAWEEKCNAALRDAYDLGQPVLIAQALIVILNVRIGRAADEYMEAISRDQPHSIREPIRESINRTFEEAERTVGVNGATEARLILQKLKADYLAIQGDLEGAKQLAKKTYAEALAMDLAMIADGALEILEDRTLWLRYKMDCEATQKEHHDWGLAHASDEELKRHAIQMLEIVGSPPAHPKKVYGHLRSLRLVAQERYRWCQHLQILEDLTQTSDADIAYGTTPTRKCYCDLFRYTSTVATVDVPSLLSGFKRQHCSACTKRQPKMRRSAEASPGLANG
jgi:hypothetical protein